MSWTNEEFLKLLNARVVFRDGKIRLKSEEEVRGQGTLFPIPPLVFLIPVDAVLEGPCADWVDAVPQRYDPDAPFGRYNLGDGKGGILKEGVSSLDTAVEACKDAKTIMVFAACCGTYCEDSFKQSVERLHPGITWVFPKTPDLHTSWDSPYHTAELVQYLMREGIIGVQE